MDAAATRATKLRAPQVSASRFGIPAELLRLHLNDYRVTPKQLFEHQPRIQILGTIYGGYEPCVGASRPAATIWDDSTTDRCWELSWHPIETIVQQGLAPSKASMLVFEVQVSITITLVI